MDHRSILVSWASDSLLGLLFDDTAADFWYSVLTLCTVYTQAALGFQNELHWLFHCNGLVQNKTRNLPVLCNQISVNCQFRYVHKVEHSASIKSVLLKCLSHFGSK